MDESRLQSWLDAYVEAWRSYDREAIAALFAEDASYAYHPYDEPLRGRDAIASSWLDDQDAPGSWETAYRPLNPQPSLADVWADERRDALFLYLHVPFCEMRCGFCNLFTRANPPAEHVDLLNLKQGEQR